MVLLAKGDEARIHFQGPKILGEATEGELANLERGCWARVMKLIFAG